MTSRSRPATAATVLDRGERLVVVGIRVDADPELAGVHVDDLVAGHRAANVGTDIATPGTPQLAAELSGDTASSPGATSRMRPSRLDEQVAVLERREQRRVQQRHRGERDRPHAPPTTSAPAAAAHERCERRAGSAARAARSSGGLASAVGSPRATSS